MSAMMRQISNLVEYSGLGVLTMGIFVTVFVGVLLWVYRKNSKEIYEHIQNLPLEDEGECL